MREHLVGSSPTASSISPLALKLWTGGRVADGVGLLIQRRKPTVGSNPTRSSTTRESHMSDEDAQRFSVEMEGEWEGVSESFYISVRLLFDGQEISRDSIRLPRE